MALDNEKIYQDTPGKKMSFILIMLARRLCRSALSIHK